MMVGRVKGRRCRPVGVDCRGLLSSTLVVVSIVAGLAVTASAATFDEQRKVFSASPAAQPESSTISLLKAGIAEGKPAQAIAEAQKWLRQNVPQNPMLLYHAGRAAELSADWKIAASLYQQYLEKADLKSLAADKAVYAAYTLLIYRLKDTNGAYVFGRSAGDRLMVCPRARQFDTWFLDQAVSRRDAQAVVNRLNACIKSGMPGDLLVARYSKYFHWLLEQVSTHVNMHNMVPVTAELVAACKKLAASITFDDEMKLRLDWAISVKAYNLAKLAVKGASPPLAKARALLAKYPRYAKWVQDGWAGGGNRRDYRSEDIKNYWPHEVEAKLAPVLAAAAKLTPLQLAELLQSWRPGYYSRGPNVLEVKTVRDYVLANPKLMNSRTGVLVLEKPWGEYTPQEAMKLAPQIQQNPSLTAALIRAKAAGGKDQNYPRIVTAYLGPEAWRFPQHHDARGAVVFGRKGLGAFGGGTPEQKSEARKKMAALGGGLNTVDVKPDAPPTRRIAVFRKLWADYRSPQPKLPSVRERLQKVLKFTPEVIGELLKDPSPESQLLARSRIQVSTDAYAHYILRQSPNTDKNIAYIKSRWPDRLTPHPLESILRQALADGLKRNKLEPWQVITWINMQPTADSAEQVKLMGALFKSPVWKSMPLEVKFAARQWFNKDAMTPGQIAWVNAADPAIVCKDLLALPKEADLAATLAALSKAIDGVKKSPVKIDIQGLDQLATVSDEVFTDPKIFGLVLDVTDQLRESGVSVPLGKRLLKQMIEKPDPLQLHRTAIYLWRSAIGSYRVRAHDFATVRKLAESQIDIAPSAASSLARIGLRVFARVRGDRAFDPRSDLSVLKTVAGRSTVKMGLVVIPVAKNHPAYPIYKSQAEWVMTNEDSAWTMLNDNWEQLIPVHRGLSVNYLKWILQRVIFAREDKRQEELIKALLAWADEDISPLTLSQKGELEIAYGDIALQKGMLPEANQIFVKVQNNNAYDGLLVQHEAGLRRAMVGRISKNFDAALKTLTALEMKRIPELWASVKYSRAEVYYDMEEYDEAADEIETILRKTPDHSEAKIMQGRLQIKRKKLMEATEVELGSAGNQKTLVPGEKLKVTLNDPALAVSGAGSEVEVVVWAESGDKERFFLRQFGDKKTKFRGEVATALGGPAADDKILQVIGDDKVYYAYSERFRKKMNNMEAKRGGPIGIASDAILMASARKLLSEAEQQAADQEQLEEILSSDRYRANRDKMDSEELAAIEAKIKAAQERKLAETRVKPGNPIHVRVVDPDRGRTAGIDELTVSVETSSGDSIGRIILKETGAHSGRFQGDISTTGAQAMAFAQNSEPGRNPNMVISPTTGYRAWKPVVVKGRRPKFRIDLNDNVAIGEMTITAKEPGAKLKRFYLQTGMGAGGMTTVAVYPRDQNTVKQPWSPSVTIMNDTNHHHARNARSVYDIGELREHLTRGWITQSNAQGVAENVAGPSEAMTKTIPGKVKWVRHGRHSTSHVVYRFRGYFYEPEAVIRRFRLELGKYEIPKETDSELNHPAQFMLAVDGRPITAEGGKLEGKRKLGRGVHRFEIWATGWNTSIGFGRSVKLLANLKSGVKSALVDCPDSFFDPKTFPTGALHHRNGRTTISSNADGTEFKIKFLPGSRGRLLEIVLLAQDGPVPALNKIGLTQPDGKQVLPVPADYAALNKNRTLEILTGDKIAVRYVDDRFITKGRKKHERLLNVAFTTADVQFQYITMIKDRFGNDVKLGDKYYRFVYGKPVPLTILDADMDVSPKPDKVTVTVESKTGGKRKFVAVEDGESSGIFRVSITPVAGKPTDAHQIQVAKGGTLTAVYRDAENTRPGVPTDRYASITHAVFAVPRLYLSQPAVTLISPEDLLLTPVVGLREGFRSEQRGLLDAGSLARPVSNRGMGLIQARWAILNKMLPAATPPARGFEVIHGRRMNLQIEAPHLALRMGSAIDVYVQTDAGRRMARKLSESATDRTRAPVFDINVPGTLKLDAKVIAAGRRTPRRLDWYRAPSTPIYVDTPSVSRLGRKARTARFTCSVPLVSDFLPAHGVLSEAEIEERLDAGRPYTPNGLVVKPGERVHIGFRYKDKNGAAQWLTGSTKVIAHPVLDVMHDGFREHIGPEAFIGERLNIRVVDLGADTTDAPDTVKVLIQAKSGTKYYVDLTESDKHTGIFKGIYATSYASSKKPSASAKPSAAYSVRRHGFPVVYGDVIGVVYKDSNGVKTPPRYMRIGKGSDGSVELFTKKHEDSKTAMRTQFALTESYLELAKKRRSLGETAKAKIELERAKQLLTGAISRFQDPATRAHAEYMLGSMTEEEAGATKDKQLKKERYQAALGRYMKVTSMYSNTPYASKAQYQSAVVYEKLGEPDVAAQEYVKLAYKYPDSEHLPTAMGKLGMSSLRKAAAYEKQSRKLLAQTEDKEALLEGAAMRKMANIEYVKAAQVFGRLQSRFPGNALAGKAGLRAGKAYMRAGETRRGLNAFVLVYDNDGYNGPTLRAEAMYWAGMCNENLSLASKGRSAAAALMDAFSIYKRLTYDFPESKWAAYARGQLSNETLLELEYKQDIKKVKEGR
jgi:outer membrane protein assembly factor BamD (BamD/ComL family)